MRAIIMMIRTFLRKLKFKPNEFRFKCALPRDLNIVISLSRDHNQLSLSINAVHSLIEFFSGEKYLIGPDEAYPLFSEFLFKDRAQFISDSELKKQPFDLIPEGIGLIWDFTRPPTIHKNLPLYVTGASYRISTDPETYPYYNIILAPNPESDDISYFEKQLRLLNVPVRKLRPTLRDLAKRTAWDYLIFKGHSEKHILVVLDLQDESLVEFIKSAARTAFPVGVTFTSPRNTGNGMIDLSHLGPEGIVATMSLADLFITDYSIYLGIASIMKIPILLMNSPTKLPQSLKHRVWNSEQEVDVLIEYLKELLV